LRFEVTVKSIKGNCSAGVSVGDTFEIDGFVLKSNHEGPVCLYALAAHIPYFNAIGRPTLPEDWINNVTKLACPDVKNQVIFAVKKLGTYRF